MPIVVLGTEIETNLSPCGLSYSPIWPWSYRQHHLPREPGRDMPTHALGNRLTNIGPNPSTEEVLWFSSTLCQPWSESNPAHQGIWQEAHASILPYTGLKTLDLAVDIEQHCDLVPALLRYSPEPFLPNRELPSNLVGTL